MGCGYSKVVSLDAGYSKKGIRVVCRILPYVGNNTALNINSLNYCKATSLIIIIQIHNIIIKFINNSLNSHVYTF